MRRVLGLALAGLVVSGCTYMGPWGRAGTPRGYLDGLSCAELEDILAAAKATETTVKNRPRYPRQHDVLASLKSHIADLDDAIAAKWS